MAIALSRCVCMVMMLESLVLVWVETARAQAQVSFSVQAGAEGADEQLARALFDAARDAYDAGQYADAMRLFEQAYARSGRPAFLFDIAHVADRLRQDQKALDSFQAYLSALPDAPNRGAVESRIAVIAASLAERERARVAVTESIPVAVIAPPAAALAPEVAAESLPLLAPTLPTQREVTAPLGKRWWLWTAVGAVVVGAVVAGLVIALPRTSRRDGEPYQSPNGIPAYRGPD